MDALTAQKTPAHLMHGAFEVSLEIEGEFTLAHGFSPRSTGLLTQRGFQEGTFTKSASLSRVP